jgi:2',5'-phosphodiesterase
MKIIRNLFPFTLSFEYLSRFGIATALTDSLMSPPPLKVRVASYNILSSHLADPQYYTTLNPDHLSAENRFPVILQKIQDEMDLKSVICLQEVSQDWAGPLHTYCANRGYYLVTGLYGKKFNGYMGVALAWPIDQWNVVDVDISRLADKRPGGWPRPPKGKVSWFTKLSNKVVPMVRPYLEYVGVLSKKPNDAWDMASNRFNILITAKLQNKTTGKTFAIGNYHMPCVFYEPKVMTIHTDLAARHVQKLAGSIPYVLAGDWNIKPNGSSYRLLTTGIMDKGDPEWPEPKYGMKWEPSAKPMRSAYRVSNHGEPEFTNYARVKEQEPFIDTLDYIFLSPEWKVLGVKPLPTIAEAGGPFPNLDRGESSDHILISADLILKK